MTREEFETARVTPMCRRCSQRAETVLLKDLPRRYIMTESHCLEKPRMATSYQREYSDLCFYHARQEENRNTNYRALRFKDSGGKL